MKWFKGSIPAAIQAAKANSAVFIVYISGDDDMSRQMEEVWNDTAVCDLCEKERCIGLSLTSTSAECKQFGEIYPVVCVPCTFFISNNGVPLEVVGGNLETRDFYRKIQDVVQMHKGLLSTDTPAGGASPAGAASEVPAAPVVSPLPATSVTTPTGAQPTPAIPEPEVQSQAQPAESVTAVASAAEPAQPPQPPQASSSPPNQTTVEDRVQKARDVIEEKRRLKAQKEKEEEKEKERERRELGASLNQFKKNKMEVEADEIKKTRLKEKREEKEARERVRKQIAADKVDRIARSQKEKDERHNVAAQPSTSSKSSETPAPTVVDKTRMETARLQFRLPDGRAFTNQFESSEPLSVAKQYVATMASSLGTFRLSTTYPKRIFTAEDMSQSLLDLNLAPSAVIVILPGGSGTSPVANTESVLSFKFLTMVLSYPFITMWSFLASFFTPAPLHTHRRPTPLAGPTPAARPSSSSSQAAAPDSQASSSNRSRPKSSYGVRRRQEGNIHRLSADDSDDEQNTWNGNSTQQM